MFEKTLTLALGLCVAFLVSTPLAAGDTVARDGLISSVGTYQLYNGQLTLKIFEEEGKLNYSIGCTTRHRSFLIFHYEETASWGPAEPFIETESNWFVLAENPSARSPRTIWIFDGRGRLIQHAYDSAGDRDDHWGGVLRDSESSPSIVTNAPEAVRDRLPESFKLKFRSKVHQD